jgi:hypothetical protein
LSPTFTEIAGLVSQGVSYKEALEMNAVTRRALYIAVGLAKGNEYDWEKQKWINKQPGNITSENI